MMYILIYIIYEDNNHEDNDQCALLVIITSALWNSCTWPHYVRLHIRGTNETKSAEQAKQGSVRFDHSVCRGSLMTTYDHFGSLVMSLILTLID